MFALSTLSVLSYTLPWSVMADDILQEINRQYYIIVDDRALSVLELPLALLQRMGSLLGNKSCCSPFNFRS